MNNFGHYKGDSIFSGGFFFMSRNWCVKFCVLIDIYKIYMPELYKMQISLNRDINNSKKIGYRSLTELLNMLNNNNRLYYNDKELSVQIGSFISNI